MSWSLLDCVLHSSKIQTLGVFREVGICGDGKLDIAEDLVVICPGWVAEVDGGGAWVKLGEEESSQVHGSST